MPGYLWVEAEAHRAPSGVTTVELRATRKVNCHVDTADPQAPLYVCDTAYDRRKTIPVSAFTFDAALGSASLTTTVEGKRLSVTWTGFGAERVKVDQNGHLLSRQRDARAVATWDALEFSDREGAQTSLLFHLVTTNP